MKRPNLKIFFALVSFSALLSSCAPSRTEQAEMLYSEAVNAFSSKQMDLARTLLDSMRHTYPDIPRAAREAHDMLAIVSIYECHRTIHFLDSALKVREQESVTLMQNMVIDDKNSPVPLIIHKSQKIQPNIARCYLRACTDPNGNFFLSSHYVGGRHINHTCVRVGDDDDFVMTQSVEGEPYNHAFTDGANVWEIVKYNDLQGQSAAYFIAENIDRRVAVSFLGPKSHFSTIVADPDKQAIADVLRLSLVLKDIVHIKGQIRNARLMINRLKNE